LTLLHYYKIEHKAPQYLFCPKDHDLEEEYRKGFGVTELMETNGVGMTTKRDEIVYQDTETDIKSVIKDFSKLNDNSIKEKYHIEKESNGWKIEYAKNNISSKKIQDAYFVKASYRPFDNKYTYHTNYNMGFIARPVYKIMTHMLNRDNVGLVAQRQAFGLDFNHSFITDTISDLNFISILGGGSIFPLYLYDDLTITNN